MFCFVSPGGSDLHLYMHTQFFPLGRGERGDCQVGEEVLRRSIPRNQAALHETFTIHVHMPYMETKRPHKSTPFHEI